MQTARGYETPQNLLSQAGIAKSGRAAGTKAQRATAADKAARALRRSRLALAGEAIGKAAMHVVSGSRKVTSATAKRVLAQEARRSGVKAHGFASFTVAGAPGAISKAGRGAKLAKSATLAAKRSVHMTIGSAPAKKGSGVKNLVAIVVTEWKGQRVVRKLHSR